MTTTELLGERLAALESRSSRPRSQYTHTRSAELVRQTLGQGSLRTNNDEADATAHCELHNAPHVVHSQRHASGALHDTGVARCSPQLVHQRALSYLPAQRVLAPS